MTQSEADVIVLGAGAAGMMCGIEAARRGRRVLVLERNRAVGEKIRISGGGRCNFTNLYAAPERYVSENSRFCTSALSRYTPADFVHLVEQHGIAYHEKKLGQLFCDSSSVQIIQMLQRELAGAGGEVRTGVQVKGVERGEHFRLRTSDGVMESSALVVATGGLSIPKMGATDFGHRLARQFRLELTPCVPALVPLTWQQDELAHYTELSGISSDANVRCGGMRFREHILFTHRGLSGPAILQISSYWAPGGVVEIDLLPEVPEEDWLVEEKRSNPKLEVATALSAHLPKRLAQRLCELHVWQGTLGDKRDAKLREIMATLKRWCIVPGGTEGFAKAEVTRGGVRTGELSPKTMEAKRVPGLYFIGEIVDVTGWLGGYNFQWAWSSGYAAGQAV